MPFSSTLIGYVDDITNLQMNPASASEEDTYLTSWNLYLKKSTYTEAMTDFVEGVASHVTTMITKDDIKGGPGFRVLGVGSGKGQTDLTILTAVGKVLGSLQTKKPAIHSVIVEPNTDMISEFKTSVSPVPPFLADLADVSFEWHEMTLQRFIESFPKIESFDMIHFVASLYYMDAKTALKTCYQKLANGGAMFCTVVPEESFFPKISRKLHTKVDLGAAQKLYTEVDLVDIAEGNSWKYEKLRKSHYPCDISSCFDESSKEGSILLDFLTHQQDFRATADKTVYKEVMEFLNEESRTDENGRILIEPQMTAVVFYK